LNNIWNKNRKIMKKKICGAVIMAAIALVSGWNISQSTSETTLSDVALVNVEALAEGETVVQPCPYTSGTCYIQVGPHVVIINGYHS
jgi:hypothetical protein